MKNVARQAKTKDLFADCSVTIAPHDDVWLVSPKTDEQRAVAMSTYHELPDVIEAVHEWTLILSDKSEISPDSETAFSLLRETLERMAPGEEVRMPQTDDELSCGTNCESGSTG